MATATRKSGAAPKGPDWHVRNEQGETFGPVDFETLKVWACDGRLAPTSEVSEGGAEWSLATSVRALEMDWVAEVTPGTFYGPIHRRAMTELVKDGSLGAQSAFFVRGGLNGAPEQRAEADPSEKLKHWAEQAEQLRKRAEAAEAQAEQVRQRAADGEEQTRRLQAQASASAAQAEQARQQAANETHLRRQAEEQVEQVRRQMGAYEEQARLAQQQASANAAQMEQMRQQVSAAEEHARAVIQQMSAQVEQAQRQMAACEEQVRLAQQQASASAEQSERARQQASVAEERLRGIVKQMAEQT